MTRKLLLFTVLFSISIISFAQKTSKAYAITGQAAGNFNWSDIREIDLSTGKVSGTIFESGKTKFSLNKSSVKQKLAGSNLIADNGEVAMPTHSMVAAAAYDRRHDKLFFTPMKIGELRWLDLSSKADDQKFFTFQTQLLNTGNLTNEANQITRMVIGADGNGYAMSNDANHLIRFTTGKQTVITDLGTLADAPSNKISIHDRLSWGGDIVSDVYGKLYLFSAPQQVFVIDIEKKVATWLGSVKNLSATYTVNGAAVADDDNVVISSANTFEGFYKINVKELTAVKLNTTGQVFNSSDLANADMLYQNQLRNELGTADLVQPESIKNDNVSIYPNPVINNQFKVSFNNTRSGKYYIALTDIQGRIIMNRLVNIRFAKQVENVVLRSKPAGGTYLINVAGSNKKSIFSDKVVIK